MNLKKITLILSTAVLGLMTTASIAAAASIPAYAKSAVNVRTGPGVSFNRVDTLHRGENVMVRECQSGWCYVDHSGPDGWVSSRYLAQRSGSAPTRSSNPPVNFGMTFGPGGPTFSFSIGNAPPRPPTPPVAPQVCFYNGANYTGSNFCVAPGTSNNQLVTPWNNRISSIRVLGGAGVQVCKGWNYSGACRTYNNNRPNLVAGNYNNRISSYNTWM